MIARITGTVIAANDRYLVIEAAGIGYRVFATAETLLKNQHTAELSLWTTHIVREDSEDLYGFETTADQDLFELLLNVSGIGPRSALGVMNVATAGTIARAVSSNDVGYLTKISGIGRKTAEKIILELRDKLPALYADDTGESSRDAIDALVALGYGESASREALRSADPESDTQTKIREALRALNGN